jgi:hypothetical protein
MPPRNKNAKEVVLQLYSLRHPDTFFLLVEEVMITYLGGTVRVTLPGEEDPVFVASDQDSQIWYRGIAFSDFSVLSVARAKQQAGETHSLIPFDPRDNRVPERSRAPYWRTPDRSAMTNIQEIAEMLRQEATPTITDNIIGQAQVQNTYPGYMTLNETGTLDPNAMLDINHPTEGETHG